MSKVWDILKEFFATPEFFRCMRCNTLVYETIRREPICEGLFIMKWQPIETAPKAKSITEGSDPYFVKGGLIGRCLDHNHEFFRPYTVEKVSTISGVYVVPLTNPRVHVAKPTHWMPIEGLLDLPNEDAEQAFEQGAEAHWPACTSKVTVNVTGEHKPDFTYFEEDND
jgi:hypothetical protein